MKSKFGKLIKAVAIALALLMIEPCIAKAALPPGDVNNDREINVADYSLLRRYINASDEDKSKMKINLRNADINGDGYVDFFDLVGLKQMV